MTRDTLPPGEVQRMFDRIAGPYDTMNRVMTAGLDRRWRELAAEATGLGHGASALDACCGRATSRSPWHGSSGVAGR
jgi:demethylmenaquinone methyltransferase / 2-methoxy-6-polyprenyl-1,4-benzoquinol methylase